MKEYRILVKSEKTGYRWSTGTGLYTNYNDAKAYAERCYERFYGDNETIEKKYNAKCGGNACEVIIMERDVSEWRETERKGPKW